MLTTMGPSILICNMPLTNESGTLDGCKRESDTCATARQGETQRFLLPPFREAQPVSFPGNVGGLWLTRYVGQIDVCLCPEGQIPALDAILDPPVDEGKHIKLHAISDVYRVQWAGRDVVVKRYNHMGLFHSLRHTVKGSRARRGWRNGQRLLELGIPTPRPVAYIDEYRGPLLWRSYLVTEYVDGRLLNGLLKDANVPHGVKRRVIRQVLRLIHKLSLHGISHGDTKHTNIVCIAGRAVLTDLDSIETHHWQWLHRRRQGGDIARFLRDVDGLEALWNYGDVSCRPLVKSRPGRQTFIKRATADGQVYLNGAFPCGKELEEALWSGREGVRRQYAATAVESSQNSRVLRLRVPCSGGEQTVYFKEYVKRSTLDWLKELLCSSRAMRAFHASLMLADAGFPSPTIVAAGRIGRSWLPKCSFLVTEEVAGAQPAYAYVIPPASDVSTCTLQDRRDLLRSIGWTIGCMHRAGIVHGDLRPGNILARQVPGGWELFFIDNERTRRWPVLPAWLRLKNLVQINMLPGRISRTDRMRFFESYMLANPSVCAAFALWAERIMAHTRRRFQRKGYP
jgi:tRNA A-37 threonylcarbamoyl transferase component Bud32